MDAFIFNAALYCENCGNEIRARITAANNAPADPDDEESYDSGDFPKGPYTDGGGESDAPEHCDSCKVFLENPLTRDGVSYVQGKIKEHFTSGRGSAEVLKVWAEFYKLPFNDSGNLLATFNRFEIAMPLECVESCAHSGACDSDVAHWAPKIAALNPGIKPEDVRAELKEYGAWDAEELSDDLTNWERIVWLAAGDIKEERAQS